jgi:hypothetical protein
MNKLTDTFLRDLRLSGRVLKKADGGGLYIHVTTAGAKLWRRVGYNIISL